MTSIWGGGGDKQTVFLLNISQRSQYGQVYLYTANLVVHVSWMLPWAMNRSEMESASGSNVGISQPTAGYYRLYVMLP